MKGTAVRLYEAIRIESTSSVSFDMNKQKKKSTFGLRLDQLAGLLGVATDDQVQNEVDCSNQDLGNALRRRLSEVMPGNSLLLMTISRIASSDLTGMVGKSLLEALSGPESGVSQLKAVKEASKSLSTEAISEQERAVATTIYHAAIASCLVHHDEKISRHSYDKLEASFSQLVEKKWMAKELVELFSDARRICQTKRRAK